MSKKEEQELKKEFALERVILFTDAVFAIILTIMVLDIKLPESIRNASQETMNEAFATIGYKLLAYLVSFALVARFWMTHLNMFKYLKDYDTNLIKLNLAFLFFTSLFPFAVSFLTSNFDNKLSQLTWMFSVYVVIVYATMFIQTLICLYLLNNKEALCVNVDNLETAFKWKVQRLFLFLVPIVFLAIFICIYFSLSYKYILVISVLPGMVTGQLFKKYYPDTEHGLSPFRLLRSFRTSANKRNPTVKNKR